MKKIAVVFSNSGFLGPISRQTLLNLTRAMDSLRNGGFDIIYIAFLEQMDGKDRSSASEYIKKHCIEKMPSQLKLSMRIANDSGPYAIELLKYLKSLSISEVSVEIFADSPRQEAIKQEIGAVYPALNMSSLQILQIQ